MQETTKYLCENIQGAALGYCQSDEITILLIDYKNLNSSAWFDNRQNKIESVAASMCTMAFNKYFEIYSLTERLKDDVEHDYELGRVYKDALCKGAMFDCRAFNIPKEEVTNNFYWRQLDASRNSIQMVGQANFSHKELQNKSCNDIQDMLMTKGINWNDLPTYQKRGSCVIKEYHEETIYKQDLDGNYQPDKSVMRSEWVVDKDVPIFRGEGRDYIEKLVMVGVGNGGDCMLVNRNDTTNNNVEFISYSGKYPCLCTGKLVLKIDGEEVKFGNKYSYKDVDYPTFWHSGGGLDNNYCAYSGEWEIDVEELPEQYRKYATEIDDVFNANVEYGCCGGCF